MGIPSYFKSIVNEYPTILKSKSCLFKENNRVFLDFNCGIHHISGSLKKIGIYENTEIFETELIKEVLNYLDIIYNFTKPKDLFYISIDGVPSRSKIIQQRYRRFNGMWKKNKIMEIARNMNNGTLYNKIDNEWNSDNISPGTIFMNKLSIEISEHIKNYEIKTILSDSLEEGEGEYKIFKYIKDNTYDNSNLIDIVYGLDADLIMLSLVNTKSKTYLLREPIFYDAPNNEKFIYFDVSELSIRLIDTLKNNYNINFKDNKLLLYSYIFICVFLGNDFIPNLSYIKINNNGIDILMTQYSKILSKYGKHIIYQDNSKWKINYNILLDYIKILSVNEDELFTEYNDAYYSFKLWKCNDINNIDKQIDNVIDKNIKQFKNIIRPDMPKWRQRYYYYLFGDNNGNTTPDICSNYIEALQWILDYYFNQTYHRTWYYRYVYSPTIIDLSNYLQVKMTNNEDIIELKYCDKLYPNIKISVDMQLMMIMPITSINLNKKKFISLISNIENGLSHYYPYDTSFNTYLKKYHWECVPKLPEFDIIDLYQKVSKN